MPDATNAVKSENTSPNARKQLTESWIEMQKSQRLPMQID